MNQTEATLPSPCIRSIHLNVTFPVAFSLLGAAEQSQVEEPEKTDTQGPVCSDAKAWESYARYFTRKNEPASAVLAWQQALHHQPADTTYRIELAIALLALGEQSLAEQHLQQVLEQQPEHVRALTQLGIIYLMQQVYELSEKYLQKVLALEPQNRTARYHLAMNYWASERQVQATHELESVLKDDPHNSDVLTDLAVLHLTTGELPKARYLIDKALSLHPEQPKARYYDALTDHLQNNFPKAYAKFKALRSDSPPVYGAKAAQYLETYFSSF